MYHTVCSNPNFIFNLWNQSVIKLSLAIGLLKAQEDIAGGQKRGEEVEEEGEDPYNEENIEQVSFAVSLFFLTGMQECAAFYSHILKPELIKNVVML